MAIEDGNVEISVTDDDKIMIIIDPDVELGRSETGKSDWIARHKFRDISEKMGVDLRHWLDIRFCREIPNKKKE